MRTLQRVLMILSIYSPYLPVTTSPTLTHTSSTHHPHIIHTSSTHHPHITPENANLVTSTSFIRIGRFDKAGYMYITTNYRPIAVYTDLNMGHTKLN